MYDIETITRIAKKYDIEIADMFHILGASNIHNLFNRLLKSGISEPDAKVLFRTQCRKYLIDVTSALLKQ